MDRADGVYSLPGGWAKHGWTTISLEQADDEHLRELIIQAWDDTKAR